MSDRRKERLPNWAAGMLLDSCYLPDLREKRRIYFKLLIIIQLNG
jgi:hypothetical protein